MASNFQPGQNVAITPDTPSAAIEAINQGVAGDPGSATATLSYVDAQDTLRTVTVPLSWLRALEEK